jgi:NAD(P)H-quinone oxidoreductase subunit 6
MRVLVESVLFYAFALLTAGSALGVALSRNMVRSAFCLLATLFGVGALYALVGADFLAGIQLLIYVGGILVLILFAVMLTHRISDVKVLNVSTPGPLAALVVTVLLVVLALAVAGTSWPAGPPANGKPADAAAPPEPLTRAVGRRFVGDDLLPFEVSSVLLLAALVGAAHLTRKEIQGKS